MQLTPVSDYSSFFEEAELEEQRLAMLYGTNPTDAARKHGIAEYIVVTIKRGKDKTETVKIRIQDVLKARSKFFLAELKTETPDLIHYSKTADDLATKFFTWLLTSHTDRYKAIDTPENVEWLRIITNMAISDYIQECKYTGYALYNRRTFANREVAQTITRLKIANSMTKSAAEGANSNIKKYKELAEKGGIDNDLLEKIQEQRGVLIDGVEAKVKDILSDNPPPLIEQYRKIKGDAPLQLVAPQVVNE